MFVTILLEGNVSMNVGSSVTLAFVITYTNSALCLISVDLYFVSNNEFLDFKIINTVCIGPTFTHNFF
jgi:hypothetical protein